MRRNKLTKIFSALICFSVVSTVITVPSLQPKVEAAAKKESTVAEKVAYFQKQIKKLKHLIAKLEIERSVMVKGSKEHIANLKQTKKYTEQIIYYSEKILELYK
ncbi:hypothetical protein J2W91_003507 [Paenibacillus amylolyticus]|uniref:Uncharacterized protein n=1 Tax=Paenibacillus amylolyticus TaxID=1451 RepID=A0AAP5H4W9_PAEAM|nr:hypothetical protein [Paenibacillus amylolyticus]MDR6725021.1 hypothetical protein [Paenibacillus amylolyticus]